MDKEERPRIQPAWSGTDRLLQVTGWAGAIAIVIAFIVGFMRLPDRVPVHFGFSGRPDRWGVPAELLFVPVIALILFGFLTFLTRIPHLYNYPWPITEENAERQYSLSRRLILVVRTIVIWIFFIIFLSAWSVAEGEAGGLDIWFLPAFLTSVALAIGWYLFAASRLR